MAIEGKRPQSRTGLDSKYKKEKWEFLPKVGRGRVGALGDGKFLRGNVGGILA